MYELKSVRFKFKESEKFAFPKIFNSKSRPVEEIKEFELGPLDLKIYRGKFTSILGRSGSGKTTLLSLLGLLRQEDEGEIIITLEDGGQKHTRQLWLNQQELELFRARQIGFALQRGELLPYLTVLENAMVVANFLDIDRKAARDKVLALSEELYKEEKGQDLLEKVLNSKPGNVSQGQYQRGAIVRALANNPIVVLADEPTGNLDEHTGDVAMKTLKNAIRHSRENNQKETTVVVVTHDIKLAIAHAEEIIVLKNGQVVGQCSRQGDATWAVAGKEKALKQEKLQETILGIL